MHQRHTSLVHSYFSNDARNIVVVLTSHYDHVLKMTILTIDDHAATSHPPP